MEYSDIYNNECNAGKYIDEKDSDFTLISPAS
jgi:hypothetical protein